MKKSQVTIKDIAKELGISASTVSRALKNHPDISQKTRDAVHELADKLNYQPNAVALSLKNSRTHTIGVIIPEIVHYFFSSVISGIEDVAYDAGFSVMICQSNEKYEREVTNAQTLLSNRVEGILVSVTKESDNFDHLKQFSRRGIPLIFFDRDAKEIEGDRILIDDIGAGYKATKHLIQSGCKRIAHLCGPQSLEIAQKRLQGYKQALEEAGITFIPEYVIDADNFELGKVATRQLLSLDTPPDGIFAVNDLTAIGAIKAVHNKGLHIPKDIAIVGFSSGRFSDITEPTLTSVDQHGYEMGAKATQLLIERIESEEDPETFVNHFIETNLIIRESSIHRD
ncbi:LacI family transcriptional regulator [Halosquirtibacter xylanolyticus]|uniref:LacI family DNA-binding transcriptional regulator n=1 Tax=Halosquirtibacter xylanolyticus TaxID=3374599 RepID=UPI00374A741A|nr:LacI family transcriptional regulator [Prolixibacteraceae bacterium]